jgi:hypothetical protein
MEDARTCEVRESCLVISVISMRLSRSRDDIDINERKHNKPADE